MSLYVVHNDRQTGFKNKLQLDRFQLGQREHNGLDGSEHTHCLHLWHVIFDLAGHINFVEVHDVECNVLDVQHRELGACKRKY